MALVLVLGFLVLMTVLVVAFFSSVTTDLASAKASASGLSARQLAASAVQVMQGTISNATEPRTDTTVAWASQPGMIRTYGNGGSASDKPLNYYKLYSSDKMIVTKNEIGSFVPEDDLDKTWNTKPALFTDLNAPITDADSNIIFPIADPRAGAAATKVEGFNYIADKVAGVVAADQSNPMLPMPVKWIYVLRDGTMTAPISGDATATTMATFTGTQIPTSANPIVGRIAFWTDDESAKVNINTASEGTYWDAPISNSGAFGSIPDYKTPYGDIALAQYQGAQFEYQRYPGHPATTCLSTIFGPLLKGLSRDQMVKAVTDAIPRISDAVGKSSMGGTAAPVVPLPPPAPPTAGLKTDIDRLFANGDELAFKPLRVEQEFGSAISDPMAVRNLVRRSQFFLTANSKAPELNLFGLPRVALWPIWDDTHQSSRTAFDKAILRCATVANNADDSSVKHPMIFTRMNPDSQTADFSDAKLNGLVRNPQIYGYLHQLMSRPVPGFGTSFSSSNKFGNSNGLGAKDQEQLLTEMFDYVRCVNLADNSVDAYTGTSAVPYTANANYGQVVPIHISTKMAPDNSGSTMGFGRISTVSELAIVLVKVDDRKDKTKAVAADNLAPIVKVTGDPNITSVAPPTQTLVEWTLMPRLVCPMLGYVPMKNNIRIRFTNIQLMIGGVPTNISYPNVPDVYDVGRYTGTTHGSVIGGPLDPIAMVETSSSAPTDSMFPTGLALVSGVSGSPIEISVKATVEIYAPALPLPALGSSTNRSQTLKFDLPSTMVPIPKLAVDGSFVWAGTFKAPAAKYTTAPPAFDYSGAVGKTKNDTRLSWNINHARFIAGGLDVIRSLSTGGAIMAGGSIGLNGDTRLVAMAENVPSSAFTLTNPSIVNASNYSTSSHCMRNGTGGQINVGGFAATTFVPGVNYDGNKPPDLIPPKTSGQVPGISISPTSPAIPGTADWDNGIGLGIDGPWINKPDEGMTKGTSDQPKDVAYIGDYDVVQSSGAPQTTLFSPNRQISSPIMFGSLPVGFSKPWQTLLFRPAKLPGYHTALAVHPGNSSPATTIPDHLLLDLFWMPVVEPYSISEPLATAGKVNLNTQIAPFTYITRNTGLHAVLKSVAMTALNKDYAASAKGSLTFNGTTGNGSVANPNLTTRYPIDATQTLAQLTTDGSVAYPVFSRATHTAALPNFFVSASQICDLPLIPTGYTAQSLPSFWAANALTGDNSLERPYSLIYSRVTTKSNVFTVHVRAQSLQKAVGGTPNVWREYRDQITGEFRGSFMIEKYYDPNEANIVDDAGQVMKNSQDASLPNSAAVRGTRWRLVSSKQFGQ